MLLIGWTRPALAQAPEDAPHFTAGNGECPEPAAVEREVLSLVPVERHELLERTVRIDIDDLGDSYRVTVSKDGTSLRKSYSDPGRDCDGRARFAAVFAVLTVMPPELGSDELAPPKPPPPPPPPAAHVVVARAAPQALPPLAHIELGALFAYAPAILQAPALTTLGGELRVALGRGVLAGTLSIAYTTRASFVLDEVRGNISQLPASAGLRVRSELGSWQVMGDLGLLAVLQRVRATSLFVANAQTALELGVRAGVSFERPLGAHFAPFAGAFAWVVPGPRDISALPQGVLGNLPYLWVGAAAGVSLGL
ncbi:MAG TPA: hypothetical protein VK745_24120 [Polyangiaceae bacterium]|nr:hypothetical protein [Polyangiaceae bacterium]